MGKAINIRRAQIEDAPVLTDVAFAAKSHWGYPENWMRCWQEALTLTPDYITTHPTYAAVSDEKVIGVCALQIDSEKAELDHLWVLPSSMGKGVGRALFLHAETVAREAGATRMTITGDPHAEGFYRLMGATVYGKQPAPMEGQARFLPLLEKIL